MLSDLAMHYKYDGCLSGEEHICIWPSWCHCHSLSTLHSFNSLFPGQPG